MMRHFTRTVPSLSLFILVAACSSTETPPPGPAIVDPATIDQGTEPSTGSNLPDSAGNSAPSFPAADQYAGSALSYTIIEAPNGTFGYDILSDGKLFIHQTNLPGQPGNEGCKTKADAEKLAEFVMKKVQGGEMPPSITGDDLKTLGIVK